MQRVLVKLSLIFVYLVLPMSLQMLMQSSPASAQVVGHAQQVKRVSAQGVNGLPQVGSVSKPADDSVMTCQIGLYIDDLHDLNMINKTYSMDMWLSSRCSNDNICNTNSKIKVSKCNNVCDEQPKPTCNKTYEPLRNIDFVNANMTRTSLYNIQQCSGQPLVCYDRCDDQMSACNQTSENRTLVNANPMTACKQMGDQYWAYEKVTGVFRQDWRNISNYPYDHYALEIMMEDANNNKDSLVYMPDTCANPQPLCDQTNSTYDHEMDLSGWQITNFQFCQHMHTYASVFGDPTAKPRSSTTYSQMRADITIKRAEQASLLGLPPSFLKLMAPAWIAFLVGLASFFLTTEKEIGSRMTLLAAALFTVVVNMRVADDTLGSSIGMILVDKLYIWTLIGILLTVGITIIVQWLSDNNRAGRFIPWLSRNNRTGRLIPWLNYLGFVIILFFYALKNVMLILSIKNAG